MLDVGKITRGKIAAEAESFGVFAHGGDAEGDVLFDGNAKFGGAVADIVTRNTFSKRFIL